MTAAAFSAVRCGTARHSAPASAAAAVHRVPGGGRPGYVPAAAAVAAAAVSPAGRGFPAGDVSAAGHCLLSGGGLSGCAGRISGSAPDGKAGGAAYTGWCPPPGGKPDGAVRCAPVPTCGAPAVQRAAGQAHGGICRRGGVPVPAFPAPPGCPVPVSGAFPAGEAARCGFWGAEWSGRPHWISDGGWCYPGPCAVSPFPVSVKWPAALTGRACAAPR